MGSPDRQMPMIQRKPLVLIVDDVPANLHVLASALRADYRIKIALEGAAALELARRDNDPPDLILLDVMMPLMSGHDVLRQLRLDPSTRDIPVVFVTADTSEGSEVRGLELGALDFLTKPVDLPVLHRRVATLLEQRRLQHSLQLSDMKLRAMLDSSMQFIGLLDTDGRVLHVNRQVLKLLALPLEAVLGKRFWEVAVWTDCEPQQNEVRAAVERAAMGSASRFETVHTRADGGPMILDFSLRPIFGDDGEVAFLLPEATDVTQQKAAEESIRHLANNDPLTGLPNRTLLTDRANQAISSAERTKEPLALMFLDLDRFKHINDTLGHRGGDQFIAVIADRLSRSIDPGATAGRIGGDEFIAVLPNCDLGASMAVATRIASVLGQPVHAEGREVPSSVSIGVAVGPDHGDAGSELLRHANAALHRAKGAGRNRVEVFDRSVRSELDRRVNSEQALRRALDDGDIVAFFQPEVDATTGQVVGAEILARWLRRDGTVVAAAEFMQVAAQAGLLERMTDHVMQQARPLIRRLSTLGLPEGFRFRLNVPPRATERSWRDNPLDILLHGVEPSLLTVDVTEASVVDDLPAAAANLAALRVRGVRVCLDDFARGVSSLNLLRKLPIDEVRIDRTSIDTITAHPHDRAIVRSIIGLVREIGLTATADGVETGAQADVLIALGCIRHQGHLYSRALPASEFDSFLAASMVQRYAQTIGLVNADSVDLPEWPGSEIDRA